MGLSESLPLIMKERGVSYVGLSEFNLVSLPFSLKLIWAPIVDSIFIKSFGRRKSWLIPSQLLCGIVMIMASFHIDSWMSSNYIGILTAYFTFLYFLMATQDIAVDGWALTMLSKANVGYGSVCNSIGQSFGVFLANQGFIALSDPIWCHRFLGLPMGHQLVNLPSFLQFWGWVFLITTVLIWGLKEERPPEPDEVHDGLVDTYKHVIAMFRLKSVSLLCILVLTVKIGAIGIDSTRTFKMQENGMPKADIASFAPAIMTVGFLLPVFLSSYAAKKPLDVLYIGALCRLITAIMFYGVVHLTSSAYSNSSIPGPWFYVIVLAVSIMHEVSSKMVNLGSMSFFSKVSDPSIGGTYMTVLNTVANFGYLVPSTISIRLLPYLTVSNCLSSNQMPAFGQSRNILFPNCYEKKDQCARLDGVCVMDVDGFTVLVFGCFLLGIAWLIFFKPLIARLQSLPSSDWMVRGDSVKISINAETDPLRKSS